MRILADIPIGRSTVEFLRSNGHDVVHAVEALRPDAPDHDLVRLAAEDSRAILCFDLDFSALVARSGQSLPSVITLRLAKRHALAVNFAITRCLSEIEEDVRAGSLVTTEDQRVRVRRLPVS